MKIIVCASKSSKFEKENCKLKSVIDVVDNTIDKINKRDSG